MELLKRVLVAVGVNPLLLAVFWLGGVWLLGVLTIVALLSAWERRGLFAHKGVEVTWLLAPLCGILLAAASLGRLLPLLMALFLALLATMGHDALANRREGAMARAAASVFALVYAGLLPAAVFRLRMGESGRWLVLLLLTSIWLTDTMAYFVGSRWGRHKGVVPISPKKSLEGFVAGIVFGFALPVLLAALRPDLVAWKPALLAGLAAGVFGQAGDLFESLLKRDAGVKDSSRLIPGHGGILDRFDSLLLAAPALYLMLAM